MGNVHNAIRRGPWSSAATAIVGDTREGGVERLGETLTPTLDIWAESRPEWALYRREQLLYLHGFQAAVAGELSCIVFEAPPGRGTLLTIKEVQVTIVGSQVLIGYDIRPAGAVEGLITKDFLDMRARQAANARPRSRVFQDSNAATALTGPFQRYTPVSAVTTVIKGPWILIGENPVGNNLALIIESGTVNLAMNATAIGVERELQPSEV